MTDNVVTNKFTGDSSSAQKAIAELEKKVESLNKAMREGKSKAKEAAIAAKAASKEAADAVAADATESRRVYRQTVAALKHAEQEEVAAAKASSAEKRRLEHADANESRRVFQQTTRALAREEKARLTSRRVAAREAKRIQNEQARSDAKVERWAQGITGVAAGYLGVSNMISTIVSQHQEMIEKAKEHGNKLDENSRKFRVQGSLDALQGEDAKKSLQQTAIKNSVTVEQAMNAGTQLASGGFNAHEAANEATDIVLKTMAATGNTTGDAGEFARSMTQAVSAFGLERNAKNLKRVGLMMAGSYKNGDFQATDMEQVAPKVQGLINQGVPPEDAMALYNIMRGVTGAEVASTGMKQFGDAHMGAKDSKRGKMLKQLTISDPETGKKRAMKATDVDLLGENFETLADRMSEGLRSLPVDDRAPWTQKFYGKEAGSGVTGLYARRGAFKALRDGQFNEKEFDSDAKINQSGSAAAERRYTEQIAIDAAARHDDRQMVLNEIYRLNQKGLSSGLMGLAGGFQNRYRYIGAQADEMFGSFDGSFDSPMEKMVDFNGGENVIKQALQNVQAYKGGEPLVGIDGKYYEAVKKQNELLERNNKLLEEQNANNKNNAHPVPQQKRPVPVNASE